MGNWLIDVVGWRPPRRSAAGPAASTRNSGWCTRGSRTSSSCRSGTT